MKCTIFKEDLIEPSLKKEEPMEPRVFQVDGLLSLAGWGARLILTSLEGVVTKHALQFRFYSTNNKVEYEALTTSLKIAKELGVQWLKVCNIIHSSLSANYKDNMKLRNKI